MRRLALLMIMLYAVSAMGCASVRNMCPMCKAGQWKPAYAHDSNGQRTAGNINTLIKAVQNGSPVRLVVDHGTYEYATIAENIWIKDGIVYAQSTSLISSRWDGDRFDFVDDSYHYYFNYSTRGTRDIINWKVGEHVAGPLGHRHDQVAVKWFVQ